MKLMIYLGIAVGGAIGAYVPVWLFDSSPFSGWSIVGTFVGSIIGIWVGYKLDQAMDG